MAQEPGLRQLLLVAGGGLIVLAVAVWARIWPAATLAALGIAGLGAAVYSGASIVGFAANVLTIWTAVPTVLVVVSGTMLAVALLPSGAPGRGTLAWPWPDVVLVALVVLASAGLLARIATFPTLSSSPGAPQVWRAVAPVVAAHHHERVGIDSGDAVSVPGIADELDARGIPYSIPAAQQIAFPPGHRAPPQYWIYVGPPPPGYQVVGTTAPAGPIPPVFVSTSRFPPPGWSQPPPPTG